MTRYVFSTTDTIRYHFPTHVNDLVMDRSEAETSEAFIVLLAPGEAPPLHIHHDMEQIFYMPWIVAGQRPLRCERLPQATSSGATERTN